MSSRRLTRRDLRVVTVGVLLALVELVVLGVRLWHHRGPLRVDSVLLPHLTQPVISHHLHALHLASLDGYTALRDLVWFGSPGGSLVTMAVLAVGALLWRDRPGLLLVVVAPLAAELVTEELLKPLVHRTGLGGLDNFPSGHTTIVTSFALLALVLLDRNAGRRWALAVLPLLVLWVAAVGLALVQVQAHYTTDVAGGLGVGVAVVGASLLAEQRHRARSHPGPGIGAHAPG